MNEKQFGSQVRKVLDQGLQVDETTAARLRAARQQALARQRPQPAALLAWADNVVGHLGWWSGVRWRVGLPLVLLLVALVGGGYGTYTWQQQRSGAELEEIDVQLLSDELPIAAYLDRGFQNWLKKRRAGY